MFYVFSSEKEISLDDEDDEPQYEEEKLQVRTQIRALVMFQIQGYLFVYKIKIIPPRVKNSSPKLGPKIDQKLRCLPKSHDK